jgi:hypothetical protein
MAVTWKPKVEEQNWNYLGYLASNVRSVSIPIESRGGIKLTPRDHKYLELGKKFLLAAIDGCSSYSSPERLFSIKDRNVPPAANALRIAVEVYTQIHATPPARFDDLEQMLKQYVEVLNQISIREAIPPEGRETVKELNRFFSAMVQKAISERYSSATQPTM